MSERRAPEVEPAGVQEAEAEADVEVQTQVEAAFSELEVDAPRVGIVSAEREDMEVLDPAASELERRGIMHEVRILSPGRDPAAVADYARNAQMRGLRVIIAGSAGSGSLPAMIATHSELPVIAVPLAEGEAGLQAQRALGALGPDAPVACVGPGAARGAAVLAARILGA